VLAPGGGVQQWRPAFAAAGVWVRTLAEQQRHSRPLTSGDRLEERRGDCIRLVGGNRE